MICVTELKSTCPIVSKRSYMAFLPAVLLTVGIAVISLWEAPQLPPPVLSLGDKVLHGLMYTLLAVSWAIPVSKCPMPNVRCPIGRAAVVCLSVTAYGGVLELLQRYCTRTRSGEWLDLLADFLGAAVGVTIVMIFRNIEISKSRNIEVPK